MVIQFILFYANLPGVCCIQMVLIIHETLEGFVENKYKQKF